MAVRGDERVRQARVEGGELPEGVHEPGPDEEGLTVVEAVALSGCVAAEGELERPVALLSSSTSHARETSASRSVRCRGRPRRTAAWPREAQLLEQRHRLLLAIVRGDPDTVLDRAEAEEAETSGEPAALEPPLVGDGVP